MRVLARDNSPAVAATGDDDGPRQPMTSIGQSWRKCDVIRWRPLLQRAQGRARSSSFQAVFLLFLLTPHILTHSLTPLRRLINSIKTRQLDSSMFFFRLLLTNLFSSDYPNSNLWPVDVSWWPLGANFCRASVIQRDYFWIPKLRQNLLDQSFVLESFCCASMAFSRLVLAINRSNETSSSCHIREHNYF